MSQSTSGLPFIKLVATGNDFLFLDCRDDAPKTKLSRAELVSRIAHRNFGVGSDGVIFVERQEANSEKLKWDFFNPDGSSAEMCGNALRCMGRWSNFVLQKNEVTFATLKGDVTVKKIGDDFSAELTFINFAATKLPFQTSAGGQEGTLINTGVPHAVFNVNSIDEKASAQSVVNALRFHPLTGKSGTNVTLLEKTGQRQFRTVTFERGVEGYTLSCGTGVLAAAAHGLNIRSGADVPSDVEADVETPGGRLRVLFKQKLSAVYLTGPAEVVCTGHLEERYLR